MTTQQAVNKVVDAYKKPDHPFWKKVGNFCVIILAPVGTVVIESFIPDPWQKIVLVAFNTAMAMVKLGTKFTTK